MNSETITTPNWTLRRDEDGLAWLALDCPDRRVNLLSTPVLNELDGLLDTLAHAPPRGLVIHSAKPGHFIAGANIDELAALQDATAVRTLTERGWNLAMRVARLPYPTLALIQGACMGGGLELSLACRYRLVCDDDATELALPEVMIGIVPAWGGMLRLPARIGAPAALDLMLTGKRVNARRAVALGLADARVPRRLLMAAARQTLLHGLPANARAQGLPARILSLTGQASRQLGNQWPFKAWIANQARKRLQAKDPLGRYPAPRLILDIWERHDGNPLATPTLLDPLFASGTAQNLMRVFRLQERLKTLGKPTPAPMPASHAHVIGAGTMGADIAAWCALRGLRVTVQDQDMARMAQAAGRAAKLYARRLTDPRAARAAQDRLILDPHGLGLSRADVVIEAIAENLHAKRALYAQIEGQLKPDALLATNTSSLSLAALRQGLTQPQRLIGLHFFNPVARMPLVEVISEPSDPDATQVRACAFVGQLGKLALPVRDAPGFLVNAALAPYMLAAMRAVDEGLDPQSVDQALRDYGMPMGPLELADTVGLDIALAAGQQLARSVQPPAPGQPDAPPACLARHVERGELGRKTGRGFYEWQGDRPILRRADPPPDGLAERLLQPLVACARRLVSTGIVADADLADAGLIFGAGYIPATGGPLHQHRQPGTA